MIEQERRGTPGDPATKAERWLEEISEAGRKRARYQEMAAGWLIDFEELRTGLMPEAIDALGSEEPTECIEWSG